MCQHVMHYDNSDSSVGALKRSVFVWRLVQGVGEPQGVGDGQAHDPSTYLLVGREVDAQDAHCAHLGQLYLLSCFLST